MSIYLFISIYLLFSLLYCLVYSLGFQFNIEFWVDWIKDNSGFLNFLKAVTYAGPMWFLIIIFFSLICRVAVNRFGNSFTRIAIKSNMHLGVFKEIVRFKEDGE
jgi:hypothetical protein